MKLQTKIPVALFLLLMCGNAHAQPLQWLRTENDTAYITDQTKHLTVRAFGANKIAKYTLGDYTLNKKLAYKANDNYNLGAGVNYKYIGLNMSFKIPFINNDTRRYGETKFFDLQSFIYLRKITADLYYLSYNGYYLYSRSMVNTIQITDAFRHRADLHTKAIGLNAQYIFNHKRFSFRAAFLQNEYQKKSAGSVIAGGGLHRIKVRGDSAIIPADIRYAGYFGNSAFTGSSITSLALNAGYAHTFVIKRHYFITTALLAGTGINYTTMRTGVKDQAESRLAVQLNGIARLAAGYNSVNYFVGMQYINFLHRNNAPVAGSWQQFETGNIRLTFAKKISLKKSTRRKLDKIENTIKDELGIQTHTTGTR